MKKHALSHMDHAITPAQWAFIFQQFKDRSAFFIETIELPIGYGHVMNGLYGPSCGDLPIPESDVYYAKRGERAWTSRMTKMPARPTAFVRVIAGPHEETCTACGGEGLTPPYSLHDRAAGIDLGVPCDTCKGAKVLKYDCILYTAYGVASKDMPAAPKEPGDIRKQMEELHRKRAATGFRGEEHDKIYAQIVALREKRTEADAFWEEHALALEVPS